MATHYDIHEMANGLRIRASRDLELWERLLAACFAAAVVGAVSVNFLRGWWLGLSAIGAAVTFVLFKSQHAELLATKVEFTTTGDLGRRTKTPRIVLAADIRGLGFWSTGFPGSGRDGLHAETAQRKICILPFLDFQQTFEITKAIEAKFPGLAEHWRDSSGSSISLIPKA